MTFSVDNYLGTGSYGTHSLYFAVERLILACDPLTLFRRRFLRWFHVEHVRGGLL